MKRVIVFLCFVVLSAAASAQTVDELKSRYERQVRNVGLSGVGVETILDKWAELAPEDKDMQFARVLYHYNKSKSTQVVSKDKPKYLGEQALMSLTDSTGKKVYYFQETVFDDENYGTSTRLLDALIASDPKNLKLRFTRLTSLREYEKEDIVLVLEELKKLVAENAAHTAWTYDLEPVAEDDFVASIQSYCAQLYNVASPSSYEAFKTVSELMLKQYPKNTDFMNNLGSYWLVAQKNPKKAISYYNKSLKLNPQDKVALTNKTIAEKQMAAAKKKK